MRETTESDVRAGRVVDLGVSCRSQVELDAWAEAAGYRGAVVAPLGLIPKADGVLARTLKIACCTEGEQFPTAYHNTFCRHDAPKDPTAPQRVAGVDAG